MERHFERIDGYTGPMPKRATAYSAGYDIAAAKTVVIKPGKIALIPTGIKVKLGHYEYLELVSRSSLPRKRQLVMPNSIGIIDSDYYPNEIMGQFWNISQAPVIINAGYRIMQGIFRSYLLTDDDMATGARSGGFGSTGGN
ncbi:dUTP diphosphatase [Schleiferilactobacillus harbinensis]|uniref:dUTP diphosphatase n=1 Tax=Schleiferilactobacillus harbinensis DSM 16991 TaxID=1122147 RepID=A0A0R1XGG0_9LACO|nr:dUTP diphosphatase [Schleiferilactobacillus harbinensis]KRM29168.1 dUTPase [Schleiferilactobacillus harbinensis DSM 16991]QFR62519.1 dUTP diphosphatase [Schleiferilactobacillus harbinensis]QFR65380.1 dUTP diphosphatase [Schleiferilactobacillus harbinensis]